MVEQWNSGILGISSAAQLPGIGFVLHNGPRVCSDAVRRYPWCPLEYTTGRRRELASFYTHVRATPARIRFVSHPSPARELALPGLGQIGFVSHNSLPDASRTAPNWLRFAQYASLTRRPPDVLSYPSLALFCTIGPDRGPMPPVARPFPDTGDKLALFCTITLHALRPPSPGPELGSFCTIDPPWTAAVACKLGSFCTIRLPDASQLPPFGFVSHKSPPPRHRGHGAGDQPSPAVIWGLSL